MDSKKNRLCGKWIYACVAFVSFLVLYFILTDQTLMTTMNRQGNYTHQYVIRPDPRLDITGNKRKNKILDSTWINLFPNLKHMVTQAAGEVLPKHFTSANHTVISINSSSDFMVGGKLYAYISAADELGHAKDYGGDYFLVMLRRPSSKIDGVLCEVLDDMNGFYRVTCILPWSGTAILNAVLMHPSESIYQMMRVYSSEKEYAAQMSVTMRETGSKKTENTFCSIGFPEKRSEELCDYSNPTHGEKWTCLKPASGKCSTITWYNDLVLNHTLLKFWDNIYFRKGVNYNIAISGSGATFQIKKSAHGVIHFNDNSSVIQSLNPTSPSGWFYESKWTSNQVTVKPYSDSRLRQCVMNRDFYFIGDSTIRQFFEFFTRVIGVKTYGSINSVRVAPRDGVDNKTNSSFHSRPHGSPLHNPGPQEAKPYITDTLDSIIEGGERSIVVMTLGYHLELFDADVFEGRLQLIKVSINALLKRLPGIKIYIKGLHYHQYSPLCPSPWLSYRYDIIIRHTFKNIEGVIYFPLWDFSVLVDNPTLHPEKPVLTKVVELFLSYIC